MFITICVFVVLERFFLIFRVFVVAISVNIHYSSVNACFELTH